MKEYELHETQLMPASVICLACAGDIEAIYTVLKHYEGYIAALSTKRLYDENGNLRLYADEEMRRRLEIKLITKILTFKVA